MSAVTDRPVESTTPNTGTPCPPSTGMVIVCFICLCVALYLITGSIAHYGAWGVNAENAALLEARAWMSGRLDIDHRAFDTATAPDGRFYNIYPPLLSAFCYGALQLGGLQGLPDGQISSAWFLMFVGLPLPFVGMWAFRQVTTLPRALLFTLAWICGTPLLFCLNRVTTEHGSINYVNQILSNVGILLIAGDLLGKRRLYPALIGLCIAIWTRQLAVFFVIPILAVARPSRVRLTLAGATLVIAVAPLLVLQAIKFGSPFETGYRYLYTGYENTFLGRRTLEHGAFSTAYLAENAYAMNLAPPAFRDTPEGLVPVETLHGVSIWLSIPLLFGLFTFAWWRNAAARWLVLAALPMIACHLLYHTDGYPEVGYRYALDYLPAWLLVVAATSRHDPWQLLAAGWSLLYYRMATDMAARIG